MTATSAPPINRYRHEESENHCNRGVECLLLAQEENYQNRELLTEASEAFIKAIEHHRQNTEAYVGMAYLLWLLKDETLALQYLEQGLRTQPSHPDIHRLIKEISGHALPETLSNRIEAQPQTDFQTKPHLPTSSPTENHNPQAQSATSQSPPNPELALQQQIQARVVEIKQAIAAENTRLIRPTINMHEIDHLKERLHEWEYAYQHVLENVDRLTQFHTRVLITCELSSLQDRILDYHSALSCSEELLVLDDKIQNVQKDIKATQKDFEAQKPGMYKALLESFYDQCDTLADALDDLENKNIPVRVLDSHYQQLVDRVEAFALELGANDA